MRNTIITLTVSLFCLSISGCSKKKETTPADTPIQELDLKQYRLVYTCRSRTWDAQKDHIHASYVDFRTDVQAAFLSRTFTYAHIGNKVSYTNTNGYTYSFEINPVTHTVSNLTSNNPYELEYLVQKLQLKDGKQSLLNKTYTGLCEYNQDTGTAFYPVTFRFSDNKFVKYGLILGNEPEPVDDIVFFADHTAFEVIGATPEYYNIGGILIDGEIYASWSLSTSPAIYWGKLIEKK